MLNALSSYSEFLETGLESRRKSGLARNLVSRSQQVDFSSNDYFGLSGSDLYQRIAQTHHQHGGTGSRSITGNCPEAIAAEETVAAFHRQEAALIFNSGYCANVGLFSCIAGRNDTFISDEYIHASIIDGMRLSHASRLKFAHNDLNDLEKKLSLASGRKFVAVESVYSMDGDESPLQEIAQVCEKHNALLIVDEAHATGIYGDKGEGLVCKYGLQDKVLACVYTFGKAIGLHGAAIAGSKLLREHLLNNARSFIFTTALPPYVYAQINAAYDILPLADRKYLNHLIDYFRTESSKIKGLHFLASKSPIQGLLTGDNFKAKALAEHLQVKGYFVRAILSPTVPVGTERLRICLHAFNTEAQIKGLLEAATEFLS